MTAQGVSGKSEWAKFVPSPFRAPIPDSMAMLSKSKSTATGPRPRSGARTRQSPPCTGRRRLSIMDAKSVTPSGGLWRIRVPGRPTDRVEGRRDGVRRGDGFRRQNPSRRPNSISPIPATGHRRKHGRRDEDPGSEFTLQPRGVEKMADFMSMTGLMKKKPTISRTCLLPRAKRCRANAIGGD